MPLSDAFQPSSSAIGMTGRARSGQELADAAQAVSCCTPATDMLTLSRLQRTKAMACSTGVRERMLSEALQPAHWLQQRTMAQVTFHLCVMPLPGGLGGFGARCPSACLASGDRGSSTIRATVDCTAGTAGKVLKSRGPLACIGGGSSGRDAASPAADPAQWGVPRARWQLADWRSLAACLACRLVSAWCSCALPGRSTGPGGRHEACICPGA